MGQKTHPKAFRLGITQKHLSTWYARKKDYSLLLQKDFFIRNSIGKQLEKFLTISTIRIERAGSEKSTHLPTLVIIKALHPRVKDISKNVISTLLLGPKKKEIVALLQKKTHSIRKEKPEKTKLLLSYFFKTKVRELARNLSKTLGEQIELRFEFCRNIFEDALLIAKFVGIQIKRRAPFRRVIKQALKKAELINVKGIKIELSGRLNGIEIARSEWKREGRIPLHTLSANIDYAEHFVNTVYGIIGIKVWLF